MERLDKKENVIGRSSQGLFDPAQYYNSHRDRSSGQKRASIENSNPEKDRGGEGETVQSSVENWFCVFASSGRYGNVAAEPSERARFDPLRIARNSLNCNHHNGSHLLKQEFKKECEAERQRHATVETHVSFFPATSSS